MTDKKPVPSEDVAKLQAEVNTLFAGRKYDNQATGHLWDRVNEIKESLKAEVIYTPMTCYKCELIYFVKASNDECTDCHSGEAFRKHMDWHDEQDAKHNTLAGSLSETRNWLGFGLGLTVLALLLVVVHLIWTVAH